MWIYLDGSDIIVTYHNNILGVEDGVGASPVSVAGGSVQELGLCATLLVPQSFP